MSFLKNAMIALVFTVSILVLVNHVLLIPSMVRGVSQIVAGLPVSPGGPPKGFLGIWLTIVGVAGTVAWFSGRMLLRAANHPSKAELVITSEGDMS